MTQTATTPQGAAVNKAAAAAALQDTITRFKATTRWLAWCDGLHAAKVASGLYDRAEYDTALSISIELVYAATAGKAPANPSKAHKHQMYAAAYRAAAHAGVDVAPGSIATLDGIADVIARVTAALAAA